MLGMPLLRPARLGSRCFLGWRGCGARLMGTARQVEAVHLADHRIAGDARTQPPGDLAGAQAFRPELFEKLHSLISPGQFRPS
jgi:hypothetical protein